MEKDVILCLMAITLAHLALADSGNQPKDKCENAGPQNVFIVFDVYSDVEESFDIAKAKLKQFVGRFNLAGTRVAIVTNKNNAATKGSKVVSPIDDRNTIEELHADIDTIRHSKGVRGRYKLSVVRALKTVEAMVDGCRPEKNVVVVFTPERDLSGVATVVDRLVDTKTAPVVPTYKAANVFIVALRKQIPNKKKSSPVSTRIGLFLKLRKIINQPKRVLLRKLHQFNPIGLANKVCSSKDRSAGVICTPPPPTFRRPKCRVNVLALYNKKKVQKKQLSRKDLNRSINKALDQSDVAMRRSSKLGMTVDDMEARFEQMEKKRPGAKQVLVLVGAKKGTPVPAGVTVRRVSAKVRSVSIGLHTLRDIGKMITLFKLDTALKGLQEEVCGSNGAGGAGATP